MQVPLLMVKNRSINFDKPDQQYCRNKWNWVIVRELKSPSLTARVEHLHTNS